MNSNLSKVLTLLNEDINNKEVLKNLYSIIKKDNLLYILLQVEDLFDELNLYVYPNWFEGEVLEGPELSKYWIGVSLKYPYDKMPDPQGGILLSKIGVKVKFEEDNEIVSSPINDIQDITDVKTQRSERKKEKVWVIKLKIPRRLIDEVETEKAKDLTVDTIDLEDVVSAKDEGFEDEL